MPNVDEIRQSLLLLQRSTSYVGLLRGVFGTTDGGGCPLSHIPIQTSKTPTERALLRPLKSQTFLRGNSEAL